MGRENVSLPQKLYPGGGASVPDADKLKFDYERVYRGPEIGTHLFEELVSPLLQQFLKGFNATVSFWISQVMSS